jgi:hypothetical protein
MEIVPITLDEANAFVEKHHRHHAPVPGAKFCLAVADSGGIVGVAIVGRPIARMLDDGWTLEVNRTCTDGTKNANSMLYGAAWRAAKALGYRKLITYTLPEESGASLRAAGWRVVAERTGGGKWGRESRPRVDTHPLQAKIRWSPNDLLSPEQTARLNDDLAEMARARRAALAKAGGIHLA